VKNAINDVARGGGIHKALLGAEKKPSKMEDDEWVDLDIRGKATLDHAYQMKFFTI